MRINLFGGSGCGKSTLAAKIFAELKARHYNVELVQEWIKRWAYARRVPKSFDQVFIFANQLHAEDELLQSGVEHLVTDSPIPLQVAYARHYGFPAHEELQAISNEFELAHPSVNIFLDRRDIPFSHTGRYEDEAGALKMDALIREIGDFAVFSPLDFPQIMNFIVDSLEVVSAESAV